MTFGDVFKQLMLISKKAEAKGVASSIQRQQRQQKKSSAAPLPFSSKPSHQSHFPDESKESYYRPNPTFSHGAPPSLPCEVYPSKSAVSSTTSPKSQLYYSKQPRDVDYKPYTLEQYKLITPKVPLPLFTVLKHLSH